MKDLQGEGETQSRNDYESSYGNILQIAIIIACSQRYLYSLSFGLSNMVTRNFESTFPAVVHRR